MLLLLTHMLPTCVSTSAALMLLPTYVTYFFASTYVTYFFASTYVTFYASTFVTFYASTYASYTHICYLLLLLLMLFTHMLPTYASTNLT